MPVSARVMEKGTMKMSNSPLVSYTKLSPNHSGARTHSIDRITPHCVVGQCSVETLGNIFMPVSKQASCNYGIGADGRVLLCVNEANRSWCTSSNANDQRAVTIECASNASAPYAFKDVVYQKLITLCVDICKRNGKKKLLWLGDKNTTLNYSPKSDEMVLTVHRWFANKSCPGDWMYARMGDLASKVTAQLGGKTSGTTGGNTSGKPSGNTSGTTTTNYTVKITASDLNIRSGPGTNYSTKGFIKPGVYTIVAESSGAGATKWGKLKSGAGWVSLDYCTKTGSASATSSEVKVGSKVTVDSGAVYGGLTTARGTKVPSFVIGKQYTVSQIATHKGEKEALLKEITSWVAVKYLNVV